MVKVEKNPTAIVGLQQSANPGLLRERQKDYRPIHQPDLHTVRPLHTHCNLLGIEAVDYYDSRHGVS